MADGGEHAVVLFRVISATEAPHASHAARTAPRRPARFPATVSSPPCGAVEVGRRRRDAALLGTGDGWLGTNWATRAPNCGGRRDHIALVLRRR